MAQPYTVINHLAFGNAMRSTGRVQTAMILFAALALWPVNGQAQGSPYVTLDHWAMPHVEHLIRAGVLEDPDPLTRPLRRGQIAHALRRIDTTPLSETTSQLVRILLDEFTRDDSGFGGGFDPYVGVGARSQGRRDFLFPEGEGRAFTNGGFHLWVSQGVLSMSTRAVIRSDLVRDPDYKGIRNADPDEQLVSGRMQDAYASIETPAFEAVFGNLSRNWGPQSFQGLLVSDVPYSYDNLFLRLKTRYIWIETDVSQLDDIDANGEANQRYWIAHRAKFNLFDWLKLWINQGTLLTGPNQQLEPWALNPFRLNEFNRIDEDRGRGVNFFIEGAFWLRIGENTLSGSLLVDDLATFSDNPFPNRGAGTLVSEGPLGNSGTWSVGYTFVSSLAYRTFRPVEALTIRDVGLGRNFSDYDQLTARFSHPIAVRGLLGTELTLLRRGEGDIRDPFPSQDDPDLAFIHQGVKETTLRVAASLRSIPYNGFTINVDLGVHFVNNDEHVRGSSDVEFVAMIEGNFQFPLRF